MWMFTSEFCKTIPEKKSGRVIFTLTGKNVLNVDPEDQALVDILIRNYSDVYFWIQGDQDYLYFSKLHNTESIKIIAPSVRAYDSLLCEDDIEYVSLDIGIGLV